MKVRLVNVLCSSALLIQIHEISKALNKEVVQEEGTGFPPIVTIVGGNERDFNYLVEKYRMPLKKVAIC